MREQEEPRRHQQISRGEKRVHKSRPDHCIDQEETGQPEVHAPLQIPHQSAHAPGAGKGQTGEQVWIHVGALNRQRFE